MLLLENCYLDVFEDGNINSLLTYVIKECDRVTYGYSKMPIYYKKFGAVEFYVCVDNGQNAIVEANLHYSGNTVWTLKYSGIGVKEEKKVSKKGFFFNENGSILPIIIVNGDLLPSYLKGEKITMQIVGQARELQCFKNESDYYAYFSANSNNTISCLNVGSILPLSFINNHLEQGTFSDEDFIVHFSCEVNLVKYAILDINGEKIKFLCTDITTRQGKLNLYFNFEKLSDEELAILKPGAILCGTCLLTADVGIYDYKQGAIKDFEHDLKLLSYAMAYKKSYDRLSKGYDAGNSQNWTNGIYTRIYRDIKIVNSKEVII